MKVFHRKKLSTACSLVCAYWHMLDRIPPHSAVKFKAIEKSGALFMAKL